LLIVGISRQFLGSETNTFKHKRSSTDICS